MDTPGMGEVGMEKFIGRTIKVDCINFRLNYIVLVDTIGRFYFR